MVAVIERFQITDCDSVYAGSNPVSHPMSITPEDAKREDASTRAGADEITGRRMWGHCERTKVSTIFVSIQEHRIRARRL